MAPTIGEAGVPPTEDAALVSFLTRVEVKLDTVLGGHSDHETRIRSLERKVWIAAGAATVIGGAIGNLAPALVK